MIEVHIVSCIVGGGGLGIGKFSVNSKLHQESQRINGGIGCRVGCIDLETVSCTDTYPTHAITFTKTTATHGTESESGVWRARTATTLSEYYCRNNQDEDDCKKFQFIDFQHYILEFGLNL